MHLERNWKPKGSEFVNALCVVINYIHDHYTGIEYWETRYGNEMEQKRTGNGTKPEWNWKWKMLNLGHRI